MTQCYDAAVIPEFSQLRILDSLLREGSLTRTAELLGMTQPTVSRALARLRRHFGDPLFVRSGQRMQATARALELAGPIAAVLDAARQLDGGPALFDPLAATRSFGLYMVDGAVVNILPQLLDGLARMDNGAAGLQLRSVHIDPSSLEAQLERGHVDLAIGRYPGLINNIRQRKLWDDDYACLMRPSHPCVGKLDRDAYLTHRHVLIEMEHTSQHNVAITRKLETLLEPTRILCHVPALPQPPTLRCTPMPSPPSRAGWRSRWRATSACRWRRRRSSCRRCSCHFIGTSAVTATRPTAGCANSCSRRSQARLTQSVMRILHNVHGLDRMA